MRNKTNNIETRDKQSKLIQRFDGIEDNNPPTNLIDDKKTGILYTSDYIDKDSYPDVINPLNNMYEESIADLDKLQRPGEWVYEIDLQFRSPINPDYGYGLLNVNDFFTIKKNIYNEICYDAQTRIEYCLNDSSLPEGWIEFKDPTSIGTQIIEVWTNSFDFLDNMQGWEISSQMLNDYADFTGPYYINIISGPISSGGSWVWEINVIDESGNIISNTVSHTGLKNSFCVFDTYDIIISVNDYSTLFLEVGDTLSSLTLDCKQLPGDTWTITEINQSFINPNTGNPDWWLVTIENENGDRPYFSGECIGIACFNTLNNNPTYNNDVRGYIKSIEVIETGCVSPITLLNSIDWGNEESIEQWAQAFQSTGVQYNTLPNQCCPDCTPYIIGNLRVMEFLINNFPEFATQCCFNIKASETSFIQFAQGGTIGWYCDNEHNCCDTNFIECADQILSLAPSLEQYLQLLNDGIVEYSSLGGESGLCALYDYIQSIPVPEYQELFLTAILNLGLVIVCDSQTGQYTYFYSAEAYINSLSPA